MGFGRIGQRVGALCRALGLRVAAFDPYMERSPVEGVEMVKDFRAILPETDFLCLHLPSTPETRDLIGAGELALLKRGAFVLNCARGGIVDEDVLCDALESGHLGGAGLDVFAKEPPDTAHRLFRAGEGSPEPPQRGADRGMRHTHGYAGRAERPRLS